MIINMVGGGGGTALNFRVVGGTTAPINPKGNIIWINTSTAITDWVFSATQPTATTGRVWITTGTFSTVEFNALKKNGIQVYPLSAKQYVSGAWVDKTAKIYQGSEWVDWVTYLYNRGNEYTDITGGWTHSGFSLGALSVAGATKSADRMTLYKSGGISIAATANLIPLNNIKKITVTYRNLTQENGFGLQLSIQSGKTVETNSKLMKKFSGANNSVVSESVEIPSGAGNCYIIFYCSNSRKADILSISYE